MPRHDPIVSMRHMLDFASEAVSLVQGRSRSDLECDRMFHLSLLKLLEMIGEAANRVPLEERAQYSEIPWKNIVGMRNRLIHGYDIIDYDVVWSTATEDLPPLIASLEKILTPKE